MTDIMTSLLELRDKVKKIYSKYEIYILPFIKFILALVVMMTINGRMGYMAKIDNIAIVLIVSLLCSFLPNGAIVAFAALFSLAHMYALSLETFAVGACLYLLMFMLFLRFTPKEMVIIILTPLLCVMKIPYVMPIAAGLIGTPASVVSVGCGTVVYYFLDAVITNSATINSMSDDAAGKLRLLLDGVVGNKTMIVTVVAFVITVMVVYLIRRMSIDHAWSIAIISGVILDLMILLVGDLMYDTNLSIGFALLGAIVAVALAKIIEFFRFCVDYGRTEKVQFEDDEYYYYVKAVPKMNVAEQTKTVKKINTQTRTPNSRGVSTEQRRNSAAPYRNDRAAQRSMTINSNMTDDLNEEYLDDYDDLFN